ncbi:hypothetical protein V7S43_010726 [Phytophthora oleae]|uniref:Uncharacterized protein n=1 Tax=Phytophthora oleae TaxID=2107226 RepID=A0ABD3FDA6_9STRA
MSVADMEAFKAVLESDRPEEELFGSPRGQVEARDATVKSSLPPVRTFSDDGKSEWVNALVPGYGNCYVRRDDLVFHDTDVSTALSGGVKDLRIGFNDYDDFVSDGLPNFLAIVGPSLKSLTLDISEVEIGANAVIRSCPNLEEVLLMGGALVDIRFNFSEFRAQNESVPELPVEWDNVSALVNHLSNPNSALAKCVRRLRIYRIDDVPGVVVLGAGYNRPAAQGGLRALLDMLKVNTSLEYLDVKVSFSSGHFLYLDEFRPHHLQPIDRFLKLPTETKAAFLSVFSTRRKAGQEEARERRMSRVNHAVRPLVQLDQHVLSTISAFAAPPVLREVYLRDPPYHEEDDYNRLPI